MRSAWVRTCVVTSWVRSRCGRGRSGWFRPATSTPSASASSASALARPCRIPPESDASLGCSARRTAEPGVVGVDRVLGLTYVNWGWGRSSMSSSLVTSRMAKSPRSTSRCANPNLGQAKPRARRSSYVLTPMLKPPCRPPTPTTLLRSSGGQCGARPLTPARSTAHPALLGSIRYALGLMSGGGGTIQRARGVTTHLTRAP